MATFTEQQANEFYVVSDFEVIHTDTDPDTQHVVKGTYNAKSYSLTWTSAPTELEWDKDNLIAFLQTQDL